MRLPALLQPENVKSWAADLARTLESTIAVLEAKKHTRGNILPLKSYTVAGLPAASEHTGSIVYVSNETGGATIAFSDGTNWRRCTDRAVVS